MKIPFVWDPHDYRTKQLTASFFTIMAAMSIIWPSRAWGVILLCVALFVHYEIGRRPCRCRHCRRSKKKKEMYSFSLERDDPLFESTCLECVPNVERVVRVKSSFGQPRPVVKAISESHKRPL